MFTSIDKAITAIVMGVLSILSLVFGWDIQSIGLTPEALAILLQLLNPLLVWAIPNKTE